MASFNHIFATVDRLAVLKILEDARTRDPDVLHSRKTQMVLEAKSKRLTGTALMLLGGFLMITLYLIPVGIPFVVVGWLIRRRATGTIATVEAGFAEYVAARH
jgi:hypothetical protein